MTLKERFLGKGRHNRTETVIETDMVNEVRQALKYQGKEVTDDFLIDTESEEIKKVCCIPVKEGVKWWNILAIPLVPCVIMLLTTYVNAQTIFLLRNEDYFDVSEDKLGGISSTLVMVGFPGAMLGTFAAGYLFDIVGRRFTLFVSFLMGACLLFTIPYTAPDVFPWLIIVRMGITLFLSAPASNPLPADYVHKDHIGKAATLIGIGFVIGEVLSMGILFNITKSFTAYSAFMIVAIIGAVCSTFFLFLVKEPKLRKTNSTG